MTVNTEFNQSNSASISNFRVLRRKFDAWTANALLSQLALCVSMSNLASDYQYKFDGNDVSLGCGLCGVILKLNTECDHCQYLTEPAERKEVKTVIVKESFFGNKTKNETITWHYTKLVAKCRCGFIFKPYRNQVCDNKKTYRECDCPQETLEEQGQSVCVQSQSKHTCTYQEIKNGLQWLTSPSTVGLVHPQGYQYRQHCHTCKGNGSQSI